MYEARGSDYPFPKKLQGLVSLQHAGGQLTLSRLSQMRAIPEGRCKMSKCCVAHQKDWEAWTDGLMDVINNQTKSFYWESCGKCGFGNI
ncbi:hypothetical protein Y1Q_0005758 [Alligator mississippiensis]|uniref:Uncharacterized protein n=1 Tax=Alligator mississippiensis TaxID=8496 RepID=A0A151MFT1_ALLMI|nr:hypothetical protein Y1Q_0005758 [Alligator mississippiensis]